MIRIALKWKNVLLVLLFLLFSFQPAWARGKPPLAHSERPADQNQSRNPPPPQSIRSQTVGLISSFLSDKDALVLRGINRDFKQAFDENLRFKLELERKRGFPFPKRLRRLATRLEFNERFARNSREVYEEVKPSLAFGPWRDRLIREVWWLQKNARFLAAKNSKWTVKEMGEGLFDLIRETSRLSVDDRATLMTLLENYHGLQDLETAYTQLAALEKNQKDIEARAEEAQEQLRVGSGCNECTINMASECYEQLPCCGLCITVCAVGKGLTVDPITELLHYTYYKTKQLHARYQGRRLNGPITGMKAIIDEKLRYRAQFVKVQRLLPEFLSQLTSSVRSSYHYNIDLIEVMRETSQYYQFLTDLISFLLEMTEAKSEVARP